ncbi:efflux transporter outer membrane subunit [Niveispirillum irakense]|uniref:efflux transporter outer membrane subunit n=1 Tax=Niveispirillum irakense TaxID=34011 RepID=UPI000418F325|nr:efflux transporter outer membrane subunit [Niveispirillum irakense]
MSRKTNLLLGLPLCLILAGCSMAPDYQQPQTGTATAWPVSGPDTGTGAGVAADIAWQDFFRDPVMRDLIGRALTNNADLAVATANVERARALYRVQRADQLPTVAAGAGATRQGTPAASSPTGNSTVGSQYQVNAGVTAFELDFFGRVRSLSDAALQSYFATAEAQRSARLSLIAEVANAYLTLLTDRSLLKLTEDTLKAQQESYDLIKLAYDRGARTQLELRQAQTTLDTARANMALYRRQVAQDVNALTLLVGEPVDGGAALLAAADDAYVIRDLPAGLPSDLLLRRPDILQAEHQLRAANANIGAARAAFFPSISLTSSIGTLSGSLSGLFESGTKAWSVGSSASLPIFDFGRNSANLEVAKAERDAAVAQYQGAVRTAFREVADELVARETLSDQLSALTSLVEATQETFDLSQARYDRGVDNYLTVLDSQRALYTAQQQQLQVRLQRLTNLVTLYKALGGGTAGEGA